MSSGAGSPRRDSALTVGRYDLAIARRARVMAGVDDTLRLVQQFLDGTVRSE